MPHLFRTLFFVHCALNLGERRTDRRPVVGV